MKHIKLFENLDNSESSDKITITKKEYLELLNNSNFLNCLMSAGVDNWDVYDYACDNYEKIEKI